MKGLRLVDKAADVQLRLTVLGRRAAGAAGAVAAPMGNSTVLLPIKTVAVDAMLRVGSYERPFTASDHGSGKWTGCARQLVKDVQAWVEANR